MIEVGTNQNGHVSFGLVDDDDLITALYNVLNDHGNVLYVRPSTMIYVDT